MALLKKSGPIYTGRFLIVKSFVTAFCIWHRSAPKDYVHRTEHYPSILGIDYKLHSEYASGESTAFVDSSAAQGSTSLALSTLRTRISSVA